MMYSAMGGVMAALTVMISKTGAFSESDAASPDRFKKTDNRVSTAAARIIFRGMSLFISPSPLAPAFDLHFRDSRPVPEGLHDHLDILPDLLLRSGIPEQIGRMVGRHERNPLITVKPPAQDADRRL